MFVKPQISKEQRDAFYAAAAARFAMDSKMLRCRASVHVENKDDIIFWEHILHKLSPKDKFHFISGSRNEYGNETSGVTQCLKYFKYLSPSFIICVDSDYRYLTGAKKYNAKNYVLQTYTYSFENHHCFADGLEEFCCRLTNIRSCPFNFNLFWKRYSNAIYKLFIWHLYFLAHDMDDFTQCEFNEYLNIVSQGNRHELIRKPEIFLDDLHKRADSRVKEFHGRNPHIDIDKFRMKIEALGVNPNNVYLYVRGHNVYDLTVTLCRDVCRMMLRQAKQNMRILDHIDSELRRTIHFDEYLPIRQIAEDVETLLSS